ncbi:four helix bundle protein [Taibaiella soli]|uniref:Four helix bundle protein n=1 Tax=Taibaiella soli TaxID=1649169 RepID=A0A2W2B1T7_9BACT|nr:four helix bundle protein [Taibaiella soli]PZF74224.1 four helix bundle protein [Taibaiella soli]
MRNYKNYDVWQKAHELCLFIYREITSVFPPEEKYGLASQLRRASSSTPLNIVEGCGRNSDKDFVRFLDMALGFTHETEYCLLLTFELGFVQKEKYEIVSEMINKVKAMLIGLIRAIRITTTTFSK